LYAVFPRVGLLLAGFEHRVCEEVRERRQIAALVRLEAARRAHELVQVLDARLAALASILLVVRNQTARLNDVIDLFMEREIASLAIEAFDELQKAMQALPAAGTELRDARSRCLPHRAGIRAGVVAHRVHALHADSARRQVHDPLERSIVVATED